MNLEAQLLKQRLSLLEYLRRQNWTARPVGWQHEFVGLCPLHPETHPSFYVNAVKNVFYCHGCGQGGDLIRFVQLSQHLSFRQSMAHLKQQLDWPEPGETEAWRETVDFYQRQLELHRPALDYLHRRGLHDPQLIRQLQIGYAPGGALYRHLTGQGFPSSLLWRLGLCAQGQDTLARHLVFPCGEANHPVNLYGRSLDDAPPPHRFLPRRPKGGLFAWSTVGNYFEVILVEGLFDLAVLWQAGFRNTTCAFGIHLTPTQFSQLGDSPDRQIFLAFDADPPGQEAASSLAQRLQTAGRSVRLVDLPPGLDPNSYFVAGASAAQFGHHLRSARCCPGGLT